MEKSQTEFFPFFFEAPVTKDKIKIISKIYKVDLVLVWSA
jgi:hypothetical protein